MAAWQNSGRPACSRGRLFSCPRSWSRSRSPAASIPSSGVSPVSARTRMRQPAASGKIRNTSLGHWLSSPSPLACGPTAAAWGPLAAARGSLAYPRALLDLQTRPSGAALPPPEPRRPIPPRLGLRSAAAGSCTARSGSPPPAAVDAQTHRSWQGTGHPRRSASPVTLRTARLSPAGSSLTISRTPQSHPLSRLRPLLPARRTFPLRQRHPRHAPGLLPADPDRHRARLAPSP
jgi:hypothetical protein